MAFLATVLQINIDQWQFETKYLIKRDETDKIEKRGLNVSMEATSNPCLQFLSLYLRPAQKRNPVWVAEQSSSFLLFGRAGSALYLGKIML